MSKKLDFLRDQQSRQKLPEKQPVGGADDAGSAASATSPLDAQTPRSGKVANDHNKIGAQAPSQTHQARRTPESRHDRQSIGSGPHNQVSARKRGSSGGRQARGSG